MALVGADRWESLEQWRAMAFLFGGVIFVADVALLAKHIASGTQPAAFGQVLVGAAWTASLIGLLGMYPSLRERARWVARIGAICAVGGALTMAAMAVTFLGFATAFLSGSPARVVSLLLPGIVIGIVLGFGSFSIATLLTDLYSKAVGLLFFLLVLTFIINIGSSMAGFGSMLTGFGVVVGLALSKLTLGYLFGTESAIAPAREHGGFERLACMRKSSA